MKIRSIEPSDRAEWFRLRCLLWPGSDAEHDRDTTAFFREPQSNLATFVIEAAAGQLGGFLEAGLRNYAEGCDSSPVAYVEGWYVEPEWRRQGLGRRLVQAAEAWALGLGLSELASDCAIDNDISLQAHQALGFEEVERIICFRKTLEQ